MLGCFATAIRLHNTWTGNHLHRCGFELNRKMKLLKVKEHLPECSVAGDANIAQCGLTSGRL